MMIGIMNAHELAIEHYIWFNLKLNNELGP